MDCGLNLYKSQNVFLGPGMDQIQCSTHLLVHVCYIHHLLCTVDVNEQEMLLKQIKNIDAAISQVRLNCLLSRYICGMSMVIQEII